MKQFAYEILEGLSYLHSLGIIFVDLKPQNIHVNEFTKLKLSDFGLAKRITDLSNIELKTSSEDKAQAYSQGSFKNIVASDIKQGTP